MRIKKILGFILLFFVIVAHAQDAKFKIFTKEDGLLSSTIKSIVQDTNGFLWIATNSGLNRYDGYHFKKYQYIENDTTSLIGNNVNSLYIDNYSRLIASTTKGYCIYNPKKDNFVPIPGKTKVFGKGICQDKLNNYYFIVGGDNCNITDSLFNTIGIISPHDPDSWIPGFRVGTAKADFDGDVWFTRHNGNEAVFFEPKSRKHIIYQHQANNPNSIIDGRILNINIDNNNIAWASGVEGFSTINKNTREVIQHPNGYYEFGPQRRTGEISQDKFGNYWFSFNRAGIGYYNPKTGEAKRFESNELDRESLHQGNYTGVFPDNQGNIWVYGANTNLNLKYLDLKNFIHIRRIPGEENTLSTNNINCLGLFRENELWIGTTGGICIYNTNTKQFSTIDTDSDNPYAMRSGFISAMYEANNGTIYVSTFKQGLSKWTGDSNNFIFLNDSFPDIPIENIGGFDEDKDGNIWCGTGGAGLYKFDPETGTVDRFHQGTNDWRNGVGYYVTNLLVASDEKIYFNSNGLAVLDIKNEVVKVFKKSDGYNAKVAHAMLQTSDDFIWFGTDNGLAKYDLKNNSFQFYTEGLPGASVVGILEDELGYLWISTDNGLSQFNPKTGSFINYFKSDGLQDNEFSTRLTARSKDGNFFFGGVNGITQFKPSEIKANIIPPKMYLTGLKLFNKEIEVGEKSILKTDIKFQEKIKLKHNQNVITIDYVGLNYFHPEKNRYEYIMEGFEKVWQDAGHNLSATYTNLNPGRYTFKVIGYNSDGIKAETPASIKIIVKPPLWRTKFAYLIYLALVGFIIYLFIYLQGQQAERDKARLQTKIDEADKEIENQKQVLVNQQEEIKKRDEEEKEIRFTNAGLAQFSELISRDRKKLFKLTQNIVVELVQYVEASAGAMFLVSENENEDVLKMMGSYAFKSENASKTIMSGEGYVGTCFQDKKTITLNNVSDEYVYLESGLGDTRLNYIVLAPIRNEEDILGVVEIASTKEIKDYKIKFIEKVGESIGSTLAVARANKKAKEMLEENRIQSEELMAQEEEMRQNIEELQATQEQSERDKEALKNELKAKEELINSLQDEIKILREENEGKDEF